MKKRIIKITAFLLCVIMMAAVSPNLLQGETATAERTIQEVEKELNECKNMLASIQKELAGISSNIKELERKSGQNEKLLESYQTEIEALEAEIEINTAIKESYDFKKADVAAQISVTEADYDYHMEMYKNLIQFIYENSTNNTFELLFTAENIPDYLSKRDNFNEMMTAANEMLKQIKSNMSDLEILASDLEETQQIYDSYISELAKNEIDLRNKVKQYETIAEELGIDVKVLREKYSNKNSTVSELTAKIKKLEKERNELYASDTGYIWPLASNVSYRLTSYFGYRRDPFTGATKFHSGIDIACAKNSKIIASRGGTVTTVDRSGSSSFGRYVVIYHGNGVSTLYAHCDSIPSEIKVGMTVKQGTHIGNVGMTGRATGYHLHFTVINTNQTNAAGTHYADPDKYLPNGYYTKKNK